MKPLHLFTLLLTLLLVSSAVDIHSQIISGKITRNGKIANGLSISKKNQRLVSIVDINGSFVIKAKAGDRLLIRQQDTTWNVLAVEDMHVELSGLERQLPNDRKKEITARTDTYSNNWGDTLGTHSRLEQAAFNQGNIFDLYGFLEGRVPGLTLSRPGGDPLAQYDAQLRGLHTFNTLAYNFLPFSSFQENPPEAAIDRSRPLIVIDGFPSASLLTVDPASITAIKVLRDAASAAEYGLRGANGVIEIETKMEEKTPFSVVYDTYLAQDRPVNLPKVLSASEYRRHINSANFSHYNPLLDQGHDTDWQEAITRTAWSQAHRLRMGGAISQTQYQFSFNYRDQQGIAKKSGFDQLNGQFRLRQQLWKKRLSLGINAGYTERSFQEVDPFLFRQASIYNPTAPVRGDTTGRYGGYNQAPFFIYFNPVAMLEQSTREGTNKVSTLGGNFRLTPIKSLEITGRYGFQQSKDIFGMRYPKEAKYGGADWDGQIGRSERRLNNQYAHLGLAYQLTWGQHRLQMKGAYTYQKWGFEGETLQAYGFAGNNFSYDNPVGASIVEEAAFRSLDEQVAIFGQLKYDWKGILFLKGSLRREGASRLGPDHKWAWFPALQGALSLHEVLDLNNRFHFRLSYGEAGQLPPKNYGAHWKLGERDHIYYQGEYVPAYDFINTPNPAIGEERRAEWNLGLDLGILSNRLMLSIDWYNSESRRIVAATELPSPPYPQPLFYDNFGALQNRGLELVLQAKVFKNNRLEWNSSLQSFTNKTRLSSLSHPKAATPYQAQRMGTIGFPGLCCTRVHLLEEGEAIGSFYGPEFKGINAEGQWVFDNRNGLSPREDHQMIGNAQPRLQFGWNNDLKLGQFDLNFSLQGVLGHKQINTHRVFYGSPIQLSPYNVLKSAFTDEISRLRDSPEWSSYYLENASFLRLQYITLGYNFQSKPTSKISGMRVYLTAQHLFTLSGYSGGDPSPRLENNGNPLSPGIEVPNGSNQRGDYFPNRTILVGFRLQL